MSAKLIKGANQVGLIRGTLLALVLISFNVIAVSATSIYAANYTITATGTQTVTTAPDQSFTWTIDGTATEYWNAPGSYTQAVSVTGAEVSDTWHIYIAGTTVTGFSRSNVFATVDTAGYPVSNELSVVEFNASVAP